MIRVRAEVGKNIRNVVEDSCPDAHENLGEAHRKHAYQLMANELHLSHPLVSSIYMSLQLAISLGFVYLCPVLSAGGKLTLETWHWMPHSPEPSVCALQEGILSI